MSNIFLQQWAIWHHTLSNRNLWGSGAPVFFLLNLFSPAPLWGTTSMEFSRKLEGSCESRRQLAFE